MSEEESLTKTIVAYILHDPLGNVEGYISDFDTEALKRAEENGMVIIAEYNDGTRAIAKASDVVEPKPSLNGISVTTPEYVNARVVATVECFNALAQVLQPTDAVMQSADDADDADAKSLDPFEAFKAAISRLQVLAIDGDA